MSALAKTVCTEAPRAERKPQNDFDLALRLRAGEEGAFSQLVELYWERLLRLVMGIVNDYHQSEDVVQEVFLLVHRKIGGFNGRSSLLTWLYRISVNAALKARRQARRRALLELGEGFDQRAPGPAVGHAFEMRELSEKLLRCLSPRLRALVILREWEGLGYEEIAAILGLSRGAVEQRLHRAMVELRKVWRPAARKEWLDGV